MNNKHNLAHFLLQHRTRIRRFWYCDGCHLYHTLQIHKFKDLDGRIYCLETFPD